MDLPLAERVFTALKTSQHLGAEWWLSQPLVYRSGNSDSRGDTNLWSPAMKSEIMSIAIETMEKAQANPQLVAQACMILANGAELTPEQRAVVLTSTSNRLTAACATPNALTSMVAIGDEFAMFSVPEIVPDNLFSAVRIQIDVQNRTSACASSPVLDMLTLVRKLDGIAALQPQLDLVLNETRDTLELINSQLAIHEANRSRSGNARGSSRGASPFFVQLAWPALTVIDNGASRNFGGMPGLSRTQTPATAILWGTHEPTADDWLEYLILLHPAMKDTVDAALAKMEPAAELPAEEAPTTSKSNAGNE